MAIFNPNVSDRSNTEFYTGPIGAGTVLTPPVEFLNANGATVSVAAAATDSATTLALANSLRTGLIALGILTSS